MKQNEDSLQDAEKKLKEGLSLINDAKILFCEIDNLKKLIEEKLK